MSTEVAAWIRCDLREYGCCIEVGGETHTPGSVARQAREDGWHLGRRSGSKPRYDICPNCRDGWRGSLTPTQRWYVRTRWLAGESVAALAFDYGVSIDEVQEQTDAIGRHAQASVPVAVPVREPESGFRCTVCRTHRYGLGEPSLDPSIRIMRCHKCGRRTPHRAV